MLHLDAAESMINQWIRDAAGVPRQQLDLIRVNARWNLLNPEEEDNVEQVLDSIIYGR